MDSSEVTRTNVTIAPGWGVLSSIMLCQRKSREHMGCEVIFALGMWAVSPAEVETKKTLPDGSTAKIVDRTVRR